ncbi:MAG: polymer-forming cytoskeletal protein [Dictyoglomaceae bacterium]
MFGKKGKPEIVDTIIGPMVEIHGKVFSEASIRIDGKIFGDVEVKKEVIVGKTGYIEGNIKCQRLTVVGKIKGNVISYESIEILSSGRLEGDLKHGGKFSVEEGGIFLGKVELLEEKSQEIIEVKNL